MTYKPQLQKNYSQAFKLDSIKSQTTQARAMAEHRPRPRTWRLMLIILMALTQAKGIYGTQSGIFSDIGRSGEGSLFKPTLGLVPSTQELTC